MIFDHYHQPLELHQTSFWALNSLISHLLPLKFVAVLQAFLEYFELEFKVPQWVARDTIFLHQCTTIHIFSCIQMSWVHSLFSLNTSSLCVEQDFLGYCNWAGFHFCCQWEDNPICLPFFFQFHGSVSAVLLLVDGKKLTWVKFWQVWLVMPTLLGWKMLLVCVLDWGKIEVN